MPVLCRFNEYHIADGNMNCPLSSRVIIVDELAEDSELASIRGKRF
jgi:hypothetical protein